MKGAGGQFSEAELVEGFKNGNRTILTYLYGQNYKVVRSFVLANSGTENDARDIFQEGMIAAWDNVLKGQYESRENRGLEPYLRKICHFRWLERTKSAAFRYSVPLDARTFPGDVGDAPDQSPGSAGQSAGAAHDPDNSLVRLIRKEEIEQARQLLGRLGERCRKILYLFYFHRKSMEEIALEMGITAESNKNQKYRCLNQLRELFYGKA